MEWNKNNVKSLKNNEIKYSVNSLNNAQQILDGRPDLGVILGVPGEVLDALQVRPRLGQGAHLQQVDEVEVLQPVGALAAGLGRVEPALELLQVGAPLTHGGGWEI